MTLTLPRALTGPSLLDPDQRSPGASLKESITPTHTRHQPRGPGAASAPDTGSSLCTGRARLPSDGASQLCGPSGALAAYASQRQVLTTAMVPNSN